MQGTEYNGNGTILYEGDWKDDKRHGQGKLYWENGTIAYEGDWKDGLPDGQGTEYDKEGRKHHEGVFKNGKMHGQGIKYYKEGTKLYEGEFEYGIFQGTGNLYYKNGKIDYEGTFIKGLPHGQGIGYYEDGTKQYEGEYKNGFPYGKGKAFFENGSIFYEGDFKEGNPINMENDFSLIYYRNEDGLSKLAKTGVSYAKKQTDLLVDILRRKNKILANDEEYNEIFKMFAFLNWAYAYGVWTNIMDTEIRKDLMVKSARNMIIEVSKEVNKNKSIQETAYNLSEYEQEFERYRKDIWNGLQQKIREGFDADANSVLFIGLEWIQDKLQLSDKTMMVIVPIFSQDTFVFNSIGKIEKIAYQIAGEGQ